MTIILKQLKLSIIASLFVLPFIVFVRSSVLANEGEMILFWGEGCPYCETLKEEIKEKGYDQDITIDYKEIYNNEENADLFDEKVKECGISSYQAGVPMLYADGSCWIGQAEAINAIQNEINGVEGEEEDPQTTPEESIGDDATITDDTGESEDPDDSNFNPQEENTTQTIGSLDYEDTPVWHIAGGIILVVGTGLVVFSLYNFLSKKS